ncbi:MAG TPA: hypothetical protein VK348_12050, partial [Planctomycetota bacterium]|nr:hypothetical protein [Planctomycetota bacterium]
MSPLVLLWLIAAPALLGIAFLRAIGLRWADDRLGYVAWAWLSGCLALGASLYAYLQFHVPNWLWWTAPLFCGLLLALLGTRRSSPATTTTPPRAGKGLLLFIGAGTLVALLHALAGASQPCVWADEGTIWSLKAKSLFCEWGQPAEFAAAQRFNLHPDYPLLDPLLQTWVYSQHGHIVHFENRLLIQLCAVALWLAFCAAVRARVPGWLACLLGGLLLANDDFRLQCRLAFADGMLALGLLVAFDGWQRWRDTGAPAWRWLSATGLAFALWSKNEACLYAAAAALALLLPLLRAGAPRSARTRAKALVCLLLPLAVVAV